MAAPFTPRQGQFLAFIHDYTKLNGRPPAEADMQRHFQITPPSVHQMVVTLEKRGLISRTPGQSRSIRLLLPHGRLSTDESAAEKSDAIDAATILGHWRITHMDEWTQEFVDSEVEGYIRFDERGAGEFHFGYVFGRIDYDLVVRAGKPGVEWSWEGNDEMDSVSGRGWAVLQDEKTIEGNLAFHQGEKSAFCAIRKGKRSGKKSRPVP